MNKNTYAYEIGGSLYLNITNRCTNSCEFCIRQLTPGLNGYYLWLDKEPEFTEVMEAIEEVSGSRNTGVPIQVKYSEVVFCGYGEPLLRPELVVQIARELKKQNVSIRINTNGQGDLACGYSIAPLLSGLVDAVSVSLNAPDSGQYIAMCKPEYGEKAFQAMLDFTKSCREHIPEVYLSVVRQPGLDINKCREIADNLQVKFKIREYN